MDFLTIVVSLGLKLLVQCDILVASWPGSITMVSLQRNKWSSVLKVHVHTNVNDVFIFPHSLSENILGVVRKNRQTA